MGFRDELKKTNEMIRHMKIFKKEINGKLSLQELRALAVEYAKNNDIEVNRFVDYCVSQLDYKGRKTTALEATKEENE